jgi:tRNA threonylcarbamoyladenosine biosynthesis protein TsaE
MAESLVLETRHEDETMALGERLGRALRGGERVGLSGELGSGKTCLVRGVACGLGIPPERVRSPSFTLLAVYEEGRLPLYHVDLYRFERGGGGEELRETIYGDGVCAIEWFERLDDPLRDFLEIRLTFVGPERRRLVAVGHGVGYDHLIEALREWPGEWR